MKGKKTEVESNDEVKKSGENVENCGCACGKTADCNCEEAVQEPNETEALKAAIEEKSKLCSEYLNMLQRSAAEFDNYKKRTVKEKEALYTDAVSDVVTAFLPAVDSLERALQACNQDTDQKTLKDGVEMVLRQFRDALKNIGVEEIKSIDCEFNPQFHNAVMHIEDEDLGQNKVVEEFQKGYMYKEKVIRHSMVKVVN
jgi:molecular chaperone GrpE